MERAEFLLKQALHEDERGRPNDALPLYTDAAELCIGTVSCSQIRWGQGGGVGAGGWGWGWGTL